ncbi:SLC13 family permease [Salsipaludibacter albus]|uniref:SLC13 family permease n=1 Tax=Salsipaludibacter albus TaxID=2849650 RepID=UPI003B75BBAB
MWFVSAVVVGVLILLVREVTSPAATMVAAMVVVLVAGVVTPAEALSGFSNPAPVTVAALYVLARGVEKTGALVPVVHRLLGAGRNMRRSLVRLLAPVTISSAFLNNTPIVAMLLPTVRAWCDEHDLAPSRFLMPLSFAALLGGTITVIGTSTNIVVSGLLEESGRQPLGFFELATVGLPITLGAFALLILLAPIVLPDRRSIRQEVDDEQRHFVMDMRVGPELDGSTVGEADLRHMSSVFLASLVRDGELVAPVTPETVLHERDRVRFVGRVDDIDTLPRIPGLSRTADDHIEDLDTTDARYFEAVIGMDSPLLGRTLKKADFRSTYQGVVMGIHRSGHLMEGKLGTVPLHVGDTLLVLADPDFHERWRDRRDFLVIADSAHTPPATSRQAAIVGVVTLAIIVAASTGLLPILQASLLGGMALVLTRVISPSEARDAVDLDVVVLIASAFGLAAAVQNSGLADLVAGGMVGMLDGFGSRGVLIGLLVATIALTGLVTNNAAALLMFPIAVETAGQLGQDPRGFVVAVAIGASVDFLTPIGYQTNTMVYGPGGYRFSDYPRLGSPLTLLVILMVALIVPTAWPG